jgi:hypothetical protein
LRDCCGSINRDHVGIDVTHFTVDGLNPGENKAIDQNREARSAGHGCDYVGSSPWFSKNLGIFRMVGAIDVPHVISESGRGRKKTSPE